MDEQQEETINRDYFENAYRSAHITNTDLQNAHDMLGKAKDETVSDKTGEASIDDDMIK